MNDLISRQAAIDAHCELCPDRGSCSDICPDVEVFKLLPSVQSDMSGYSDRLWKLAYERGKRDAQQKWIPVTERLPDNRGWYLISDDTETWVAYYSLFDNEWCGINSIPLNVVIAWQPLPEPYKENQ